jgi:hypothetical protein
VPRPKRGRYGAPVFFGLVVARRPLCTPTDDEYAFRKMDRGMRNLASFTAEATYCCRFEFIEGRLYFIRAPYDSNIGKS